MGRMGEKGEKVLVAKMTDYPDIPEFKKDALVKVGGVIRAIFQPLHGSITIQYQLNGLMQDPVCKCCGIAIHDGESCHSNSEINQWPYYDPDDEFVRGSNPWSDKNNACYSLTDYSGETFGSFGLYTGYDYDDCVKKIVVVYDDTGLKIGCGVLYPQDWVE